MNPAIQTTDGTHDFDFLFGRWRMHHRRLRERLRGSQQWDEYDCTGETVPLPEGLGNREEVRFDYGGPVTGLSFRFYDHDTRQWAIYWIDSRRRVLDRPVVGSFVGDTAVFLGEDTWEGTPIVMRFVWSRVQSGKPRWEQAFSTDGGRTWETNWVIDLEPAEAGGPQ
jgi:hypothetical protein